MTYAPQIPITSAYQWLPNTETVTVKPTSPTGAIAITPVYGIRRALKLEELQAYVGLGVSPSDLVFDLWADELSGYQIASGDTITDTNSVGYIVLSAALKTLATRWRIIARRKVG